MPGILRLLDNHDLMGHWQVGLCPEKVTSVVTALETGHLRVSWRMWRCKAQVTCFMWKAAYVSVGWRAAVARCSPCRDTVLYRAF